MLNLKDYFTDLTDDIFIENITSDTRDIDSEHTCFVAINGVHQDGHDYVAQAFELGANVAIVERIVPDVEGKQIVVADSQYAISKVAALLNDVHPEDFVIIGVTGTDGKTSTATMIHDLLKELGHESAYIGTNGIHYGDIVENLRNTTPLPRDLYRYFAKFKALGIKTVIMEASSHALATHRTAGLKFDYGIFTNLTHDHLDFHKTMDGYMKAKQMLFEQLKPHGVAIINQDDPHSQNFIDAAKSHTVKTYGFHDTATAYATDIAISGEGTTFTYHDREANRKLSMKLIGDFNVLNMLAAIEVTMQMGYSFDEISIAMQKIPSVAGRMELLVDTQKDVMYLVDFAHAPNAVRSVLNFANKVKSGRLIVITGAVGDGDFEKRPEMAELAIDLSDIAIFTMDEPYNEDPQKILDEMTKDLNPDDYIEIYHRQAAIDHAKEIAQAGDIIAVLGRGRNENIFYHGKKLTFNDYEYVQSIIKESGNK